MDFPLWKQLLEDAVYWQKFSDDHAFELYHRTAVTWGLGDRYWIQGPEQVDLTNIFEQYTILAKLKGTHHGKETDSS